MNSSSSLEGRPAPRTATSDEPHADFGAWWLAVLLAIYNAFSNIDRIILVHLVDLMKADLHITDFEFSLVLGPAYSVAFAIFGYPSGWAADRIQRRLILFAGVLCWSLATMLTAFATSFLEFVAFRVVVAIGEAVLIPTAASMLADRFPTNRLATGMAVYNVGPKSGQALAFLFAGAAISLANSLVASNSPIFAGRAVWELVMIMVGAPGLFLAFLVWTVREPARRNAFKSVETTDRASFIEFLRTNVRVIAPLFMGFCLAGLAATAMVAWTPAFLVRTYGWTAVQYGPWMSAVSACGAFSVLFKGALVDWLYSRGIKDASVRFYTWLLCLAAPIGVLAFFAPNPYVFFVAYFFVGTVALPFLLYALTSIQLFAPTQFRGRLTGLFMLILPFFSSMLGPPATAAITDFVFRDPTKVGLALAIVAAICLPTALVLLRYALSQLAKTPEPEEVEEPPQSGALAAPR